jgi:ABC-type amino acid transport substrate-binding protein
MAFGGLPTFVECAENLDFSNGICRDITICVGKGTTHEFTLSKVFKCPHIVAVESPKEGSKFLEDGSCKVYASDAISLSESRFRAFGFTGEYKVGTKLFSKEPFALVTRDDDVHWSRIVNLVIPVLITAEKECLNSTNIEMALSGSRNFDLDTIFKTIISTIGNMDEMYSRHLVGVAPRSGLNVLNLGGTGLIYSFPYGDVESAGPPPRIGGVIDSILERGRVRCGVTQKAGLAEFDGQNWTGLDIEFCKGFSAALFVGDDNFEVIEIVDATERFFFLAEDAVDVLTSERVSLIKSWFEPTTGDAYSFSPPYYYDMTQQAFAFATRQDDPRWSDLIYWVVMSSFYAQENGYSHSNATKMPIVKLYGEGLQRMMMDFTAVAGNYGDMLNQGGLLQAGRNELNMGGPEQYAIPLL